MTPLLREYLTPPALKIDAAALVFLTFSPARRRGEGGRRPDEG